MTLQDIIDGIIAAIRTEYDTSFRIYTEKVEQGLIEPCFSILCVNGQNEQSVGDRYNREYLFNVTYFPSTDEPISECLAVMEVLYDALAIIDVGDVKLRGARMNGEVVDGVLQFQITYAAFLLAVKAETNMEDLEVETYGKE